MKLLPFDHSVRNLGRSPKRLALVVGGSALVSLLVLGATSFARGMERALGTSGLATNALLLGSGSEESVERSEIPASTASILAASVDGLAVVAGAPAVSPEIHAALPVARADAPDAAEPAPVPVRGIEPAAFLVHPQVRLAEGRWPARGADEVAAARGALRRLGDPAIGETLVVAGTPCALVGVFDAPGTAMHGELWMRLDRVAAITLRSTHSCVVAALGEAEYDDVDAFAASRIDLETITMLESDYYARLGEFFAPIRVLVLATALLVSLGGVLGGVNAMYAAFASRVREVGMLQALGFSRGAIAVSLLVESTIACLAGALIACAAGLALLDGLSIDYSMGSFGLSVDASAVAAALATGLLLGLVGALPAIARSLFLPITHALRA